MRASALAVQINGGGQELRRRAGTEKLPAIAGFAAALDPVPVDRAVLRDGLEKALRALSPDVVIFGSEWSASAIQVVSPCRDLLPKWPSSASIWRGSPVIGFGLFLGQGGPLSCARRDGGSSGTVHRRNPCQPGLEFHRGRYCELHRRVARILDRSRLVKAGRDPAIAGKSQERYPDQVRYNEGSREEQWQISTHIERIKNIDVDKYKYGFTTDIESERAPKGLSEEIVALHLQKEGRAGMDARMAA